MESKAERWEASGQAQAQAGLREQTTAKNGEYEGTLPFHSVMCHCLN